MELSNKLCIEYCLVHNTYEHDENVKLSDCI